MQQEPIQNHFFKLSDISTTGPHKKRQRLAEKPIATIPAACATEKPFCISKVGQRYSYKTRTDPCRNDQEEKIIRFQIRLLGYGGHTSHIVDF